MIAWEAVVVGNFHQTCEKELSHKQPGGLLKMGLAQFIIPKVYYYNRHQNIGLGIHNRYGGYFGDDSNCCYAESQSVQWQLHCQCARVTGRANSLFRLMPQIVVDRL